MKNKFKFILVVFLLLFGLFACDTGENNKDDKENNDDVNKAKVNIITLIFPLLNLLTIVSPHTNN